MNYLVKRDAIFLHTVPFTDNCYPRGTAYLLCQECAHEGDEQCIMWTVFRTDDGIRFKLKDTELEKWAVEVPDEIVKELKALKRGLS